MYQDMGIIMSREIQLLEELLTKDWVSYYYPELINSIKELLAKPELENNIVCWGSFDLGGKCVGTHDTRRLAAQIQGGNEVLPLYLKQEPREPLSDEELSILATDDLYDCTYTTTVFAYEEYARKIEKAHGIGE